jgi:hypothetical protein
MPAIKNVFTMTGAFTTSSWRPGESYITKKQMIKRLRETNKTRKAVGLSKWTLDEEVKVFRKNFPTISYMK